jgi:hypothetical protein
VKLLRCHGCRDVLVLGTDERRCRCGASSGLYPDATHPLVQVGGPCEVYAVDNHLFERGRAEAHRMSEPHPWIVRAEALPIGGRT